MQELLITGMRRVDDRYVDDVEYPARVAPRKMSTQRNGNRAVQARVKRQDTQKVNLEFHIFLFFLLMRGDGDAAQVWPQCSISQHRIKCEPVEGRVPGGRQEVQRDRYGLQLRT